LTLVPWQSGKPLTWDVTVVYTLADYYVSQTSRSAGAAAELAASRKSAEMTTNAQMRPLYCHEPEESQ